jgi:hypothetical protein
MNPRDRKNHFVDMYFDESRMDLKSPLKTYKEQINENDIVNFSSYAGMYSDGAHAYFTGKDGKMHKIAASGDRPRKYYIDGKEVSWDEAKRQVGKQKIKSKQGMNEDTDLSEKVEIDHSRYMRSHGKKARDSGNTTNWMFTSKEMGKPKSDEMVTISGKLSAAAKEAAKKLGTNRVYVMEEVGLTEKIMIDIKAEVESILGKKLDGKMLAKFRSLRQVGYANPYDIVKQLKESLDEVNIIRDGRKFSNVQWFETDKQANDFLEKNPGYGVLHADKEGIYVAKNTNKGKLVKK